MHVVMVRPCSSRRASSKWKMRQQQMERESPQQGLHLLAAQHTLPAGATAQKHEPLMFTLHVARLRSLFASALLPPRGTQTHIHCWAAASVLQRSMATAAWGAPTVLVRAAVAVQHRLDDAGRLAAGVVGGVAQECEQQHHHAVGLHADGVGGHQQDLRRRWRTKCEQQHHHAFGLWRQKKAVEGGPTRQGAETHRLLLLLLPLHSKAH